MNRKQDLLNFIKYGSMRVKAAPTWMDDLYKAILKSFRRTATNEIDDTVKLLQQTAARQATAPPASTVPITEIARNRRRNFVPKKVPEVDNLVSPDHKKDSDNDRK